MNLEKANGEVKICADSDQTKTCVLLLTFCVNNIKVFIFSFVFSLFLSTKLFSTTCQRCSFYFSCASDMFLVCTTLVWAQTNYSKKKQKNPTVCSSLWHEYTTLTLLLLLFLSSSIFHYISMVFSLHPAVGDLSVCFLCLFDLPPTFLGIVIIGHYTWVCVCECLFLAIWYWHSVKSVQHILFELLGIGSNSSGTQSFDNFTL